MKTIDNPLFLLKTIVRPFSFALLTMLVSLSNYAQSIAGSAALEDHTSVFTPLHKEDLSLKKDPSTGFMPDLSLLDQPMKREVTETQRKQIAQNIAALPISFRKNMGQWDNNIIYRGSSPGWNANINFMKNGLSFGFLHEKKISDIKSAGPGEEDVECLVWNLNFRGANTDTRITAEGKENSHISYIYNIDVDKQQLNVPDYRMISYNNIYDNIDLRYYNAGKELKYDYIIQPGGNMNSIQMNCDGIEKLTINNKGQLEIKTVLGTLLEEIPESYQILNGVKKQVKIHYKLIDKTTFGFYTNERYSTSEPLVIDPVTLAWCTMLGPAGDGSSYMQDIAIDAASNVYGVTDGTPLYPTTPGVYSTGVFLRGYDTYIFKFNSTATTLIWGTFVSTGRGNNTSDERSIALDVQNNVYIVGRTCPACGGGGGNLITTPGAYDVTYNGPAAGSGNAYFLKLNNAGSTLLYSSYLGSASALEKGEDIAVSSTGLIYVTGGTQGPSFPVTAGAFDVTHNGGNDIFLSVINPAGAGAADLVYSTFIGGTGAESGLSLAIDPLGRACISGSTGSANFPTTVGAYSTVFGGATDAFACKINPGGAGLADMIYSTFLGGAAADGGTGIVVNAAGEVFLTGNTASANFPVTAGAYDVAYGGAGAIFALKLNVSGTTLLYSTYIEGISGPNIALSSASCDNNEVFISASAGTSPPITSCAYRSTAPGPVDVIVLKLKMAGTGVSDLLYSTYFGGNAQDYSNLPICANAQDEVFVAYTTHSTNTPTTAGVFGPNPGGTPNDISVVFKLKPSLATLNYTFAIGACNNTVNFTGTASGTCIWQQTWTPNYWKWDFGDGQTSNLQNPAHVYGSPGTYNVKLIVGCPKDSITKTVVISPTVTVTSSLTNSSCAASNGTGTATPAGGTSPYTYSWSNGQTNATATGLAAGTYTITVRDASGCIGQKTIIINASGTLTAAITLTNKTCTVEGNSTSTPSGGTPGYTYSWSNGQTTQTATNLSSGTYTVKITDAAGCSLTQSVSITQPASIIPVISSGKQATCGLNNGNSTVTTSGGTAPYTYNWNNGQTTQTATGLGAGNYTVTVRDANGCSSTQKAVITTIPPSSFTVTSTNGTCGNGGSATATATGGTVPFTYSWSGMSQTTNSVSAISAGNYTITVTDANGCSSTKTFTITDTPSLASATFTVSPGTTVCVGTPVTFTNTGTTGTYNWVISTITPANVSGTTVDFSYTFLTAGTYSVSHTVTTSGCSKNVVTPITVTVCSGSPSATATGSSVCPGTCATATSSATGGTAPYTYSWNNGATTQNISPCPASTTTYTVTIRDSGGNTSTSTAVVTVNPVVTVSVTPTNIVCNGGSGSASATGSSGTTPYTYTWGGGISGSTISGLSPGTYTVTITDNKGCTATNTTAIIAPQPLTGQFTKGTANCSGCGCKEWVMVNATGGTSPYSYTWSVSGGYVNRYKNQLCPGAYTVNVTDKNGCSINVNLTAP